MSGAAQRARQELREKISGQLEAIEDTLAGQERLHAGAGELIERLEAIGAILDGYRTRAFAKGEEAARPPRALLAEQMSFNALLEDFRATDVARHRPLRGSRLLDVAAIEQQQRREARAQQQAAEEEVLVPDRPEMDEAYDRIERMVVEARLEPALTEFLALNARTQKQKLNFESLLRHEQLRRSLFEELDNFTKLLPADGAAPAFESIAAFIEVFFAQGEAERATHIVLGYATRCLKLAPPAEALKEHARAFLQLVARTQAFLAAKAKGAPEPRAESALMFSAWAVREYRAFVEGVVAGLRAQRADLEIELEDLKNELGEFGAGGLCLDFVLDEFVVEARERKGLPQRL